MGAQKRVWIMSFRIAGNDGVSLEAHRWGSIFRKNGFKVTYVAGELDRRGILIPELHFNSPEIFELHKKIVFGQNSYKQIQKEIFRLAGNIEGSLRDVLNGKKPDLLVVANVFSLPMHFPLAIALSRIIQEYNIPTIARHHDFWWERKRYLRSTMFPFYKKWFPPNISQIKHVVINSISQRELLKRYGLKSEVIADSFDFKSKMNLKMDTFSKSFRKDFGIGKKDTIFLQATRIVPRKRIELSIELLNKLNNPENILVIAGHAGDEGKEYEEKLKTLVAEAPARVLFIGDRINSRRKILSDGTKIYTLWDAFMNCDLVTYPTELEGFGNQFIEAVYFKKPVILTVYPVFKKDIKPKGFKYIDFKDTKLAKKIQNLKLIKNITDTNFDLGCDNYSYQATWEKIKKLL